MAHKSTVDTMLNLDTNNMKNLTLADKLLKENKVTDEWISFIDMHPDVRKGLEKSVSSFNNDFWTYCTPKRELVFKSLAFQPPQAIKVIIVGHDPIPGENATGLAFSSRRGTSDASIRPPWYNRENKKCYPRGWAFKVLHDALKDVGYLDKDKNYDCCHEVWAQRGVLLYNASLTWADGCKQKQEHFEKWKHFTKPLLLNIIRENEQERLFVLCWGTNAKNVGKWLYHELTKLNHSVAKTEDDNHSDMAHLDAKCVIAIGDHPTYPRDDTNNYKVQVNNQFSAIRRFYPKFFKLVAEGDDPETQADSSSESELDWDLKPSFNIEELYKKEGPQPTVDFVPGQAKDSDPHTDTVGPAKRRPSDMTDFYKQSKGVKRMKVLDGAVPRIGRDLDVDDSESEGECDEAILGDISRYMHSF